MKKINDEFKNYLVTNDLAIFVDQQSFIEEDDDCSCQILVLNRPDDMMLGLTSSPWNFETSKVILVYNCETKEVTIITLKFDCLLPGTENSETFNFGNFSQMKRQGNQIILTQQDDDCGRCLPYLYVVIFDITGKVLSTWKISDNYRCQEVDSFGLCNNGCWLVKFGWGYKKTLILLTLGGAEEYDLFLQIEERQRPGSLVETDINEIKTWFSDVKANPKFFILVSSRQLCAYSLKKHEQFERYEMMTNIITSANIEKFKAVHLDKSFAVEFEAKASWCGSSNFFLSFEPDAQE